MTLYKVLKTAVKEEDVNYIYRKFLSGKPINSELPLITQHRVGVDGLFTLSDFIMLLEFKYDKDFTKRSNTIEVIIQILYYLKRFEEFGEDLPDVCFVGDINECFCFHSNDIIKYLSLDTDWSLAPSVAGKKNVDLFKLLYDDKSINPFIHELDDDFKIDSLLEEAINLSKNIIQQKRITEKNVNRLFTYFVNRVLRGKKLSGKTANELVNVFITTVLNKDQNYVHPHKPNTLITKSFGNVLVNGNIFKSFFKHYQRNYSIKERDRLTAICDRLIEDTTRRFKGEFFTPTEWVDEAYKMIEAEFGEDWKEKYIVWDPAWGTGNLTRDYKFKELYASTLNRSDLDIAEQMGYNPEATKFQFDFLNDSNDKLPLGLQHALKQDKPIIVLMNPPYGRSHGRSKNFRTLEGSKTKGQSKSNTQIEMIKHGPGQAATDIYVQFLYKTMCLIPNIIVASFNPVTHLTGPAYKKFRKKFLYEFTFNSGFIADSKAFSDTAGGWPISFSIFSTCNKKLCNCEFNLLVLDYGKFGTLEKVKIQNYYNLDGLEDAKSWASVFNTKGKTRGDIVCLTNPMNIANKRYQKTGFPEALGTLLNNTNMIGENSTGVALFTGRGTSGGAVSTPIFEDNFNRIVSYFTARKTISSNWINKYCQYIKPSTEHPGYKQWNNDCIVYSLFNNKSQQSSLRDITYRDKQWDIINEWFWMSNKEMKGWAEDHAINEIELDCKNCPGERFVYKKLQETPLSDDAKELLRMAETLVVKSLQYRRMMIEEHPEYHLNTWDAGWYQIKLILKKYMPDDLKVFVKLYKKFEDRMREGVYKFGFLKE